MGAGKKKRTRDGLYDQGSHGIGRISVHPRSRKEKNDKDLKKKILNVLLSMNSDPEGINILRGIGIDGFIKVADDFYNPIRDMERKVKAGSETGRQDYAIHTP